ncbi:DUF4160 domain-containing protein [Halomonas lactosivorans]|uniref:DUF4160 domain-containing protein n=1 Tax=Billgrantia lactosivorans TaxID=2185141 RepID=UPI000DAC4377
MPVVFRYKGIRFFFYSNEGNPLEPMHIHAESGGGEAKIWVMPACAAHAVDRRRTPQRDREGLE